MKLFPQFLSLALSLAFSSATLWAAPTQIAGVARNGTDKNKVLPNATVQLVQPEDGGKRTIVATTRTDASGRFVFPPREYGADQLLMANINHGGFDYWTVAWDGGNKLQQVGIQVNPSKVDLLVFDTTNQAGAAPLRFQVHHLAIEEADEGLKVVERVVVQNLSNLTFMGIGPNNVSVLLNIPEGAKNVKLDPKITDAKLVKTSNGWGFSRPITPEAYGSRNAIIVSYDVPWQSALPWQKSIDLSREVAYPTMFFFVARTPKDEALKVDAPQLGAAEEQPVPIDGKTETRIVNAVGMPAMPQMEGVNVPPPGPALEAGKQMKVVIERPVNPLVWGFAALTLGLCLFIPAAMVRPKRKAAQNRKSSEPTAGAFVQNRTSGASGSLEPLTLNGLGIAPPSQRSRGLIQRIAELDDQHEAGRIADDEYRTQRAAWKKQLIESLAAAPDDHGS